MAHMFGEKPLDNRPAFSEFSELTRDYLFGEIWSRPGLEKRDRSLITVAILTATGKEPQLKVHMKGAVNNGVTADELKEIIMHTAHYAGWPCTVNGLRVLQELADELGLSFSNP